MLEVKEMRNLNPIFLELKGSVNKQNVMSFEQGVNYVLRYKGRLYVNKVDEPQDRIMEEYHSSIYSIHMSS